MVNIKVDFKDTNGIIKDMNGVNNGPTGSYVRKTTGTAPYYKELNIPYARLHDASFFETYGGEYSVDVHRVFPDFDADVNDPASYIFGPTDKYIASIFEVGTKPFYRLGASIEHGYKRGTYPPKDYKKWAEICEHIILHYTQGWADGFNYDMEYWEVWNEPDCCNHDGTNPCWQGTEEEFMDFFEVSVKYLKNKFPNLKIGGPAMTGSWPTEFRAKFYKYLAERNIPIDFYAFHTYLKEPDKMYNEAERVRKSLAENGIKDIEIFVDEWNYVRAWLAEDYAYSMRTQKSLKGSSLVAGTFCSGQKSALSKLMYYNAAPSGWCGIFSSDNLGTPFKTYYSFKFFDALRQLGTYVNTEYVYDDSIYMCAATDGEKGGILVTNYSEHDTDPAKTVKFDLENIIPEQGARIKVSKIDEFYDGEVIVNEPYDGDKTHSITLDMELFSTYLIEIEPR